MKSWGENEVRWYQWAFPAGSMLWTGCQDQEDKVHAGDLKVESKTADINWIEFWRCWSYIYFRWWKSGTLRPGATMLRWWMSWAGSSPGGLAVMEGQSCSLHIGWKRKRVLNPVNLGLGWMTQWTRMFRPGCLPSTTHEERLSEFLLYTCS